MEIITRKDPKMLSNALASICHNLILAKLKAYGLRDSAIQLVRSYLSEHKQRVISATESILIDCQFDAEYHKGVSWAPYWRHRFLKTFLSSTRQKRKH